MTKRILVTGGAGFMGCNLARSLASDGLDVTIFDGLVRKGSQQNLCWLQQRCKTLQIVEGECDRFQRREKGSGDSTSRFSLAI